MKIVSMRGDRQDVLTQRRLGAFQPCGNVPNADFAAGAAPGNHALSIGRPGDLSDVRGMPFENLQRLSRRDFPDADGGVERAAGSEIAARRRKRQTVDVTIMSDYGAH